MTNTKIRDAMKKKSMSQWRLADLLGVSENTINRWLRHELPEEEQERILALIQNYNS